MTTGAASNGEVRDVVFPGGWGAVGAATTVVALACGVALEGWAQGAPPRHDMFEPFLDPWRGLTWITVLALWMASVTRRWPWLPLTAIGLCFVLIQVWMVIGAASTGLGDGKVGGAGALAGGLSITQVGLTLAWIVLIVRSKRMPS